MNKILLDLPNKIITPRLTLRIPQAGDGKAVHKIMTDMHEELVKWINIPNVISTIDDFELQCRIHNSEWTLRNDMRFLIIDSESGAIMGRAAFPPALCNWSIPLYGISYSIGKAFRGNGYVTEAINAMIRFAFDNMKAKKVEIKCDVLNVKSVAVPQRLGMKLEAVQLGNWPSLDKDKLAEIHTYVAFNKNDLPEIEVQYF